MTPADTTGGGDRGPRAVHRMLDAAEAEMARGSSLSALSMAQEAAAMAPSSFRAARTLSGFLAACGHPADAIAAGERAALLQPADAELRFHMGGLLLSNGHPRSAVMHLGHHVALDPGSAAGWRMLSTALVLAGRPDRALEAVDRAIALQANDVEFRLHRASLLSQRERYEEALDELQTAVLQEPGDARIHRTASGLHEVLGEFAEALAAAGRAAALAPDDAEIAVHHAHVSRLLGIAASGPVLQEAALDPSAWLARPARPPRPLRRPPGLAGLVAARWRVVHAVILREMRTRFGRSRLGYLWAILEPLSHLLTLGTVFALFNHSPPPVGDSLFLYYLTGLLPFLMFNHVSTEIMSALSANGSVLQLPAVKRLDIIGARGLLHLATEVAVGIVAFAAAAFLGAQGMPHDPLVCAQAVLTLWILAMGVGSVNIVLSEFMPSWETFYNAVLRLMYFASGIYYSPISMPDWARSVLVWNPVLQGVEFFRSGFYSQYQPHWLDVPYLSSCAIGTLLVGLALERAVRRHIRVQA